MTDLRTYFRRIIIHNSVNVLLIPTNLGTAIRCNEPFMFAKFQHDWSTHSCFMMDVAKCANEEIVDWTGGRTTGLKFFFLIWEIGCSYCYINQYKDSSVTSFCLLVCQMCGKGTVSQIWSQFNVEYTSKPGFTLQ